MLHATTSALKYCFASGCCAVVALYSSESHVATGHADWATLCPHGFSLVQISVSRFGAVPPR